MGVSGQRYALGKGPPVPIGQEVGWAPELVWTQRLDTREKTLLPLPGIEPRSPGRLVRSQTLYLLSYPGSKYESELRYNPFIFSYYFFHSRYTIYFYFKSYVGMFTIIYSLLLRDFGPHVNL
jgi:hypothetical protein